MSRKYTNPRCFAPHFDGKSAVFNIASWIINISAASRPKSLFLRLAGPLPKIDYEKYSRA